MDFSKFKKISFILLILLIIIFPFWCVKGLCAERLDFTSYSDRCVQSVDTGFAIVSNSGIPTQLLACKCTEGGTYTVYSNIPEEHSIFIGDSLDISSSVDFIGRVDGTATVSFYLPAGSTIFVTTNGLEPIPYYIEYTPTGMTESVNQLIDNVGINQVWEVFEEAIPYISVVALFVFGFVIITYLYLKISKGKGGI